MGEFYNYTSAQMLHIILGCCICAFGIMYKVYFYDAYFNQAIYLTAEQIAKMDNLKAEKKGDKIKEKLLEKNESGDQFLKVINLL